MRWFVFFTLLACTSAQSADRPERNDAGQTATVSQELSFRLLAEPRYQGHPVWEPLSGSREIGLSPARLDATTGELVVLDKEGLVRAGLDFPAFQRLVLPNLEAWFATITPRTTKKSSAGQVTHVIYHDKNPLIASLVLAPQLHARHKDALGDIFLAVIPDRHTLFLCRADPEMLEAQGDLLSGIFEKSIYPISLEVLQIDASGIRGIGNLRPE